MQRKKKDRKVAREGIQERIRRVKVYCGERGNSEGLAHTTEAETKRRKTGKNSQNPHQRFNGVGWPEFKPRSGGQNETLTAKGKEVNGLVEKTKGKGRRRIKFPLKKLGRKNKLPGEKDVGTERTRVNVAERGRKTKPDTIRFGL